MTLQGAKLTPHEWQDRDISELLFWDCTGLVAVETGGGKSLLAVEVALRSGHHTRGAVLVVAPKSTFKKTWEATFVRQGGPMPKRVDSTKAGKIAEADMRMNLPGVYLINHELFTRRDWSGAEVELCIVDEAHKVSNRVSKGWKSLMRLHAKRRIAMSATPYRNNFENIWSILRWLYPERSAPGDLADRSFWRWADRWCVTEMDYFAGKVVRGELVPGKLVSSLPCYIYHAKRAHCCDWHPNGFMGTDEPETIVRTVQMTPAMKRAYKQLEDSYVTFLNENPLVVELPIVLRSRLRELALGMISVDADEQVYFEADCDSPKFDDLMDILNDEVPGEQVLVVTHSRKFALVLADKLRKAGVTVAEWNGSLSQDRRDEQGALFESGDARVLVATIASLGTGTDFLQRVTSTIVWMSRTDDPTENKQTEGRLDRMGSLGRVTSIEIQMEGTYDEGVLSKDLQHAIELNKTLGAMQLV